MGGQASLVIRTITISVKQVIWKTMGACTCKASSGGAQPQPLFKERATDGTGDGTCDEKVNITEHLGLAVAEDDSEKQSTLPSETDMKDDAVVDSAAIPGKKMAEDGSRKVSIKASTQSSMKGWLRPWCCS